jgi:hypothetical protein
MHDTTQVSTVLIVAAVLLFFFLGVAIMVIMDHKARLPGGFTHDPFSITGMRRDHPVVAFLTAIILLGIIAALVFEMMAALVSGLGFFKVQEPPTLLARLKAERTAERIRHFHHSPPQMLATQGKKNVCFPCHGDYPHSKEPMVRTLLNMHTQFIGCMTCHADARKVPEHTLTLRWLNYSGIAVKGAPYGTDIDPRTGGLSETDDYYSKIVAYTRENGNENLLEITADDPEAREFAKIQDRLSDQDREAVKKTFHKRVSPKGRFCSRCHTDSARSYMPFRELGFSERRTRDLTNLGIIGLVEKYRDFYLPTLTKSDKSLPPLETLTGPKPAVPAGPDMRKDPRSWWKGTYDAPRAPAPKAP